MTVIVYWCKSLWISIKALSSFPTGWQKIGPRGVWSEPLDFQGKGLKYLVSLLHINNRWLIWPVTVLHYPTGVLLRTASLESLFTVKWAICWKCISLTVHWQQPVQLVLWNNEIKKLLHLNASLMALIMCCNSANHTSCTCMQNINFQKFRYVSNIKRTVWFELIKCHLACSEGHLHINQHHAHQSPVEDQQFDWGPDDVLNQ